jgi:hypothetical protein
VTIGKKKKRSDWGQSTWEDTVATSCGLKCLASSECGGFNYNRRLGKCYYRKNAECGRPQRKNKNNDCWVKSNWEYRQFSSLDSDSASTHACHCKCLRMLVCWRMSGFHVDSLVMN